MSYGQQAVPSEVSISFGPSNRVVGVDKRAVGSAASGEIFQRSGFLMGYSARETTGSAAATARLIDGGDSGGTALAYPAAPSGLGDHEWFGPQGLPITAGLYLSVLSGTMDITVWVRAATEPMPPT